MWLWILSALFILLVWGVWFVVFNGLADTPSLPMWVPIAISAAVVLGLIGLIVYRRIRAARAARALEKAIAEQAQEQALAAKPERRAEIQELHRQVQEGINALKASTLGGGKRGAEALYALPWYVIVGPPGAGKTTALRHSGLVFPYLDPAGGGVRGVGGTRNCDWWFTNDAILLDTAGRYTTEDDDRDEWLAFLDQLKKYRPDKPVNGILVAVSANDLVDQTDEQIQETAQKVRARIDEMQDVLQMTLPVYMLFTKMDLVAGFVEFFGDLKKSERAVPWGATFALASDKGDPKKIFTAEFEEMAERVYLRSVKRVAAERNREAKEKIFFFPRELNEVKRNLAEFMGAAFSPSSGKKPTPILRGFYFTSGTQEGRPMDRVLGAMARNFGLRPAAFEEPTANAEAKSYFLRDVFTGIVFPDADVAALSEAEIRKKRIRQMIIAGVAAAVAILFLIPTILAFSENKDLVDQTRGVSDEAKEIVWADATGPKALESVDKLKKLKDHVELLDRSRTSFDWFMDQRDTLYPPTRGQYITSLREGFVRPTREYLEGELNKATADKYWEYYNLLRTYLLLDNKNKDTDPATKQQAQLRLKENAQWEMSRLEGAWAEKLKDTGIGRAELKDKLFPHVAYYVELLWRGEIDGETLDQDLINRVRQTLAKVEPAERYYKQLVEPINTKKKDESGPATADNLLYPPVTLQDLFPDRQEALSKIRSRTEMRNRAQGMPGVYFQVQGAYTIEGHKKVLELLKEGYKQIERENWVIPLTDEEKQQSAKIQQALDRVRLSYDSEYIRQWEAFFRDIDVEIPDNNKEAIEEFNILATRDWPYQRLLKVLDENTQFKEKSILKEAAADDAGLLAQLRAQANRRARQRTGASGITFDDFIGNGSSERYDPVPDYFLQMVRFGVPPEEAPPKEGEAPKPPAATSLSKYIGLLEQLSAEMSNVESGPPNPDTKKATESFLNAVRETEVLLLQLDKPGQELMRPLLMNPLRQAYRAVVRSAGGAASGLWEIEVWPEYEKKIKDRYPFNLASTRDASFEDATAFFKPKDGVLWGFYDKYLKDFHYQVKHDFYPLAQMQSGAPGARPYTPFLPNMYNCLKRAHEITDSIFVPGGEKPNVAFNVNLKTVSPIVSEVVFEIDGQIRRYRNEKELWYSFTWPGKTPSGASIRVRGAGGLDEEIKREGPWGIFRLFETGTVSAEKDSDDVFTVTWQMTAPPVTVVMEVRPSRSNHPFVPSFFRATNCPPSIGDSFGGG
ncbi:MAG: type VI secretion system membrane subunit TssM, partial [Polyangiaceae bacterium]